jgi:hypothetical protein
MKHLFFFLGIWCSPLLVFSQLDDVVSRTTLKASFKPVKKIQLETGVQARVNLTEKSYSSTNWFVGTSFEITKGIRSGFAYRNAFSSNDFALLDGKQFSFQNRFQLFLKVAPTDFGKGNDLFSIDLRSMMQFDQSKFEENEWTWRNKLTFEPKLKSKFLKPYVAAEFMYGLNQNQYFIGNEFVRASQWNEFRYTIGTSLKLGGGNNLDLGVMYRDYPADKKSDLALLLTFEHAFKRKGKD